MDLIYLSKADIYVGTLYIAIYVHISMYQKKDIYKFNKGHASIVLNPDQDTKREVEIDRKIERKKERER